MKITLNLVDNDGVKHEMTVPYSLHQITISQYYDFQIAYDTLVKEAERVEELSAKGEDFNKNKVIEYMIEACKVIVPNAEILPLNPKENITEYIRQCKLIEANDELTISLLYAHLFNVAQLYKSDSSKKVEFEYKGDTYKVRAQELWRSWMVDPNYVQMSAGEYLWINEFQRHKAIENEKKAQKYGVLSFRLNLFMLAMLARKEGEQLPYRESELREFVLNRAKHFQEVPASVALDVAFFLSHLIELYEKTPNSNIFSNQSRAHLKVAHRAKPSSKK